MQVFLCVELFRNHTVHYIGTPISETSLSHGVIERWYTDYNFILKR